jgi:hypothetical protein
VPLGEDDQIEILVFAATILFGEHDPFGEHDQVRKGTVYPWQAVSPILEPRSGVRAMGESALHFGLLAVAEVETRTARAARSDECAKRAIGRQGRGADASCCKCNNLSTGDVRATPVTPSSAQPESFRSYQRAGKFLTARRSDTAATILYAAMVGVADDEVGARLEHGFGEGSTAASVMLVPTEVVGLTHEVC